MKRKIQIATQEPSTRVQVQKDPSFVQREPYSQKKRSHIHTGAAVNMSGEKIKRNKRMEKCRQTWKQRNKIIK